MRCAASCLRRPVDARNRYGTWGAFSILPRVPLGPAIVLALGGAFRYRRVRRKRCWGAFKQTATGCPEIAHDDALPDKIPPSQIRNSQDALSGRAHSRPENKQVNLNEPAHFQLMFISIWPQCSIVGLHGQGSTSGGHLPENGECSPICPIIGVSQP